MNGNNHTFENKIYQLEKEHAVLKAQLDGHAIATEKALDKTEAQLNKRLESMNEFREQLRDQSSHFLTMDTYDANHKLLESKIEERYKFLEAKIEERYKFLEAKIEPIQRYIGIGIGGLLVINIAIGIILHFI
jgi:flagellar motility protein MotE (MotC chaperone)